MARKIEIRNVQLCVDMANAFLEVGIECNEKDRAVQTSGMLFRSEAFFAIPAIVNTAFACELYLKAILIKLVPNPVLNDHALLDLFHQLPESIRSSLNNSYKNKSPYYMELEEVLAIHSESFKNWRYAYEIGKERIEAYPDNLIFVAEALRSQLQAVEEEL